MSIRFLAPAAVHVPGGAYSHGASVEGPGQTLHISGQVGLDRNGVLAEGFAGQASQAMRNLVAILAEDGMTVHHLVKLTVFLTDISHAREFGAIRATFMEGAKPASTLVATPALVMPDWLIEIEAVAFKPITTPGSI